jgi:hypothetical protein
VFRVHSAFKYGEGTAAAAAALPKLTKAGSSRFGECAFLNVCISSCYSCSALQLSVPVLCSRIQALQTKILVNEHRAVGLL